jgi:hypothetical protein
MIRKYTNSGIAMSTTSNGMLMIYSPLRENITMIVKSKAINVSGEILGIKWV